MLRRMLLVFGLSALGSLSAQAQNKVELFGAFSYMRFHSSDLNGWEFSAQYKFGNWLGGGADIDGHYGLLNGIDASTYKYLFGPQISLPSRVSPFGHLLFGGAHISTAGSRDSSFSKTFGGGIDARLANGTHWRMIQADYLTTHFRGSSQNNLRFSSGILIRF